MDYSRLRISVLFLIGILAFGTVGYSVFEEMDPFDAFYMTLITISTVGFSEIKPLSHVGRLITVIIIISGISVLTYTLGQVAKIFVEGELRRILGRRKLERQISALRNHFIICGYGRIGSVIAQELASENIPFVIIEEDPAKAEILELDHVLYITKDATAEESLISAGIAYARGIVTAVQSDANNVFITLTAKDLRPDIFVLSRASDEKNETKMRKAGATRVVCPYLMGGRRMAQLLTRPTVMDFIDTATMDHKLGLSMEEAVIGDASNLVGKSLMDSHIRQDYGVIIVAIKKPSSEMIFNPGPMEKLEAGDVIVVIGKKEDLQRMDAVLK
ncbi:MAG: potassium channel protein [Desulfobacteraceae bacterium]|nr:potassium channel protein [Desulfobacteraceae bacterium]